MSTKTLLLVLAAALLAAAAATPAAGRDVPSGGWMPVKDPNDPHIRGLGSWAVAEHARRANSVLRFVKVTTVQELQVVAEVSYRLFLDAADADGNVANYGAVVYEDDRTNTRELTSFARADDVTGTAGPRLD